MIARHGLRPRKSLGQNFLLDLNLTGRIAREAGVDSTVRVLEIGPGPGGLTRALLQEGAQKVVAIERDGRCLPALQELQACFPDRLEVFEADALSVDQEALVTPPVRVVANLPYNVGTALLVRWMSLGKWPPWYDRLVLMFQKEVAQRIVAAPGSSAYGRLSVLAQWRSRCRILFNIPARAFTPPPKVVSSVVELVPHAEPPGAPALEDLEHITAAAFGQRRKMLRQSLKAVFAGDTAQTISAAGLDPTARAQDIEIDGFLTLARTLAARRQTERL